MASTLETQAIDANTAQFLREAEASPFDFHSMSVKAAGDEKLKRSINNAVLRQHVARQLRVLELPGFCKVGSARWPATSSSTRWTIWIIISNNFKPPSKKTAVMYIGPSMRKTPDESSSTSPAIMTRN